MHASPPTLRELALTRRLPAHQAMDQGTLDWIARNAPPGHLVVTRQPWRLTPHVTWFTSPEQANGIHGVRHGARVSILAALLAADADLTPGEALALGVAAAVHDCRRRDDRSDPGHGNRAAAWLRIQGQRAPAALGVEVPGPLLDRAADAVGLHDDDRPRHRPHPDPMVGLLRAADALDRYRLPLARWWPDLNRLDVPMPAWMPPLAHRLVVLSEQAALNGAAHHDALNHAHHTIFTKGTSHVG